MNLQHQAFDLASLQAAYRAGVPVRAVILEAVRRCGAAKDHHAVLHACSTAELEPWLARLEGIDPASLPLYGVPFAVKDNIDVASIPTTAGCPEYAYTPTAHAFVVARLIEAGAVPVVKANLDQFATGLNGTRAPGGACRNAFDPAFISGGSSSGSAVLTALGAVAFALGTDTAGSGRVPAAFHHLIGLKPTCGLLSSSGVVPACRSLDTVSILALTAADAQSVLDVAAAFDPADPYSRPPAHWGADFSAGPFRFGVPRAVDLQADGGSAAADQLFAAAVERLQALGGVAVEVDLSPFLEVARLLYDGPWVAERYLAIRAVIEQRPEVVFPAVRTVIAGGAGKSALDTYAAMYRLKALKRICDAVWQQVDCLVTPTAPGIYRVAEMEADPVRLNSNLGRYTNFMNLLDYAAVAVPAGFLTGGQAAGLPWGVTLAAPAHADVPLLRLADRMQRALAAEALQAVATGSTALSARAAALGATDWPLAGTPPCTQRAPVTLTAGTLHLAVCGAHLSGQPLNGQLTSRGARLRSVTRSAPQYRLYALGGGGVARPGMVRVAEGGAAIEVEVWELPVQEFGSFVVGIPAPLGIGKVQLADGSEVTGFICEPAGIDAQAVEITGFGGWRAWLASRTTH